MRKIKLFLSLLILATFGISNAWAETKNDVVSAIGFAGITTDGYTTAGMDYSAVANTTNNTSVTYAMQVFDGKTGAVRGNKSGNANFSCRNTTTCDGYYISKVVLTVTDGTLDGATNNRSVVYFGTSAYANPTTAPTGTSTKSAENATGTTLTWNNTNEEASYFILYNLKTSGTLKGGQVTITWTKKSGGTTPDPAPVTVSLNKTELNLQEGATETLTATVTGSAETVSWSSSAADVASVDNTGKVTAVAAGEATITAAIGDVKATCEVTVTAATTPDPEPGTGGETTTVTYVFTDDSNCPGNDQTWFNGTIDEFSGWTATKGTNDPKYYTTGAGLRVYNGGKFTITSTKVMTSITLTFAGANYTFSTSNTATQQTVTPNAKSYEWSVGRTCRLQKIEITYAADAGGSEEPALSATPTEIDFGTVYEGATVADKTVAVNFANLNGDVTYSVLSTPFSATGNISTTGDNITISADASTIGEYSQTLIVASTTDSKTAEVTVKMNVVAAPAPTGTFEKFTGTLEEGDYVLVANGTTDALKSTITDNRFDCGTVEVAEDKIVNPDKSVIWHIAANDKYWTMYNESATKYAGGTTSKNQGALLDDVTDLAKWTITVDGEGVYTFENYGRSLQSSNAGNKFLSKNSQNSYWATYASGQKNPVLYKKSDGKQPAGLTYETSKYRTKLGDSFVTPTLTNPNSLNVTYSSSNNDVAEVATDGSVTIKAVGGVEITATFAGSETHRQGSAKYTICVTEHAGTQADPYSVADARRVIDVMETAEGVYATGIVSEIATAYNSQYGNISYNISADGLTTSDQLQAYRGKSYDGANFTSADDVKVGDEVVIKGTLKKYNTTYEFDENNQLVSLNRTKEQAGLSYTTTEYNVNLGEAFTAPTLNNPHTLAVTYSSNNEDVATVDTDGSVTIKTVGMVTITASFAGDASYAPGEASYTIKVMGIASLPFAFDGKCADIANTAGMSQEGIDLDDYTSSPHLKINTTGDYLTIHFDSEPDKLTYDIKGNSFSGGTFTVQESADGETYTTIATYTELGEKVSEEKELESTSRYVKFIYTEKVNGNVALGNISITKPDTRKDAGLAWSKETVTLTVGDAFTAPTLSNPNSLAVSFESSNDEVATVTAEGVIALVDDAVGTATITASFLGDATYKPATATFVVIVNEYVEIVSGVWQLVTDAAALKAGDKVIVASAEAVDSKYYALSTTQNKNNRGQADVNKIEENVTFSTDVQVLTLEVGVEENTFAFNTGSGYLYAASSSSNHLKTQEDLDANGSWTISIDANTGVATVKAQGGNTHNLMQYNKSSKLFSSYDNPQQDIALYKKMPDYTRVVDPQYYGTICLPKAGKFVGGSLYEVAYYDETAKKVYFDEVLNGEMEAGMPYIFLANATMIEAYYTNDEGAAAKNKNGLYGTLVDITSGMNADGVYMIYRNQIIHSTHSGSYLNANRAYIKLAEVPGYNDPSYVAPAPAPGRKRIAMGTTGQNTATGIDQVQGDNVPTKMIINGQFFILRGEKMYDAQGKLVK